VAPTEEPPPEPAGESVLLDARASDQASIIQAGRDVHLHSEDGVRRARKVVAGAGSGQCPYPGLSSFTREEAQWFFGREQLTSDLVGLLDQRLRTGGLQVVVAPSGAGKSSLIHAGLLARLDAGALPGSSEWPTLTLTPTADPLAALAAEVAKLTGADPKTRAPDPQVLLRGVSDRIGGERSTARVVVVVDQFEELFTLCADEQTRRTFIELLHDLAEARALVVLGVRADFYAACADHPRLRKALQDRPLVVGPMSEDELREAVLFPARDAGLDVEPGLIELLLRDLADAEGGTSAPGTARYAAGRLPLLAHALRSTWQQRHGHILSVDGYLATGGIHRAVARTAEEVFSGLNEAGQRVARTLFLRLVKIGDSGSDTRRRIPRTELLQGLDVNAASPVLDAFTQKRLLTQDQDTVEITHEALLRAWPRLTKWIGEDRAGNLIRQNLDEAAASWNRDHHDPSALYRGTRLEAANASVASTSRRGELSPVAVAFLAASTEQERLATEKEHRADQLRRVLLVAGSALGLIALVAAGVAFYQAGNARQQRDNALFNQITAEADRLASTDISLAAQLDLTAYRRRSTQDLYTALVTMDNTALSTPLTSHTNFVNSVAFSPDGRTLATGSRDQTVRLWNVTNPAHPTTLGQPLTDHTNFVYSVAFSPDGHTLASGSADQTVRLWNLSDPAHPALLGQPLTGHTNAVGAVAFSPDGHTLASGSYDNTARLWNIPVRLLTGYTNFVNAVAFSPDGHTLASGSGDRTVRLWNVSDPAHPILLGQPLTGHTNFVNAVAFSPDGRTLASGSGDRTVRLWNVTDPAHPTSLGTPLTGHTNAVEAVMFSPDGRTLTSGGDDQTVRLWNLSDPAHPMPLGQPLTGHTNYVYSVAFSPDGRTLASGSADQTVRLWNVTDPAHPSLLGQPLTGHTKAVASVAFSPDGHILATGNRDWTVRLWDMDVERAIQRICATTTNNLTPAMWEKYVSTDLPYSPPCR
jgi:WD40 repeat protein